MLEDRKDKDWTEGLNTPQPIHIHLDGQFYSLYKQDVEILKVSIDDTDTIYNTVRLLNGLLKGGIVYGEIEQVRDLLQEIVGS